MSCASDKSLSDLAMTTCRTGNFIHRMNVKWLSYPLFVLRHFPIEGDTVADFLAEMLRAISKPVVQYLYYTVLAKELNMAITSMVLDTFNVKILNLV